MQRREYLPHNLGRLGSRRPSKGCAKEHHPTYVARDVMGSITLRSGCPKSDCLGSNQTAEAVSDQYDRTFLLCVDINISVSLGLDLYKIIPYPQ